MDGLKRLKTALSRFLLFFILISHSVLIMEEKAGRMRVHEKNHTCVAFAA